MNKFHILSLVCFVVGIIFFALGFLSGDVQTGIFLVFPFIAGSGLYAFGGFIFIFIAILLFISGFTNRLKSENVKDEQAENKPSEKPSIKGGGVVLIGPIPIVFGSNWKIAAFLMLLAIFLILFAFFFLKSF